MQKPLIDEQLQILLDKKIHGGANKTGDKPVVTKKEKPPVTNKESEFPYFQETKNVFSFNKNYASHSFVTETEVEVSRTDSYIESTNSQASTSIERSKVTFKESKAVSVPSKTPSLSLAEKRDEKNEETASKIEVKEEIPKIEVLKKESAFKPDNKAAIPAQLPTAKELVYSDYRPLVPPTRRIQDHFKVIAPRGRMARKHEMAAPYYIFYTTITDSKETHRQKNSITFQELLDPSLGELKCSLQINFMIDIGWLLAHYYFAGYSKKRMTILYGEDMPDLQTISQKQRQIDAHMIPMANPFGKHHTKMMLLCYEDGALRVVISTANLYIEDWENRVQGLWMSPRCPPLAEGSMPHDGESPTMFKRHLLQYLDNYRSGYLTQYTDRVRKCDFSAINVFFVSSVPGGHETADWGMPRVGSVLSQHCSVPSGDQWTVCAQSSSLGSFGKTSHAWLCRDFLANFSKTKQQSALSSLPPLKVIYPSLENVQLSHDGLMGGGCLPYSATVHTKQPWLLSYLHQWKATRSGRDRAMPHIKTYLRLSPDGKQAAYYLLTSSNLSKAAWGTINKKNRNCRINNYEVGVLFLPQFVINKEHFPLVESEPDHLSLVYDVPPIKYSGSMSPWVMEYLRGD